MRWPQVALPLVLVACGPGLTPADALLDATVFDGGTSDPTAAGHGDGIDVAGDVDVDAIAPRFGTNAGGTTVLLTGGPFTGDVEVRIGGELAELVANDGDTLEIRTPATTTEGWVDLELATDDGQTRVSRAFQFWPDGLGKTGAFAALEKYRFLNNINAGETAPESYARASLEFVVPTDKAWWERFVAADGDRPGGCAANHWDLDNDRYDPNASLITWSSAGGPLDLEPVPDYPGVYTTGTVALTDAPNGTAFSLESIDGDDDWPRFEMNGFVQGMGAFNITSPNFSSGNVPKLNRSFTLNWGGSGGTYTVLDIMHLSPEGDLRQWLTCVVADTGSYTIPSNAWPEWRQDDLDFLQISVGRVIETRKPLPFNDSDAVVESVYWNVGFAEMRAN